MRASASWQVRSALRAASLLVLVALAALFSGAALEAKEVPYLSGHVNDMANLIAADARQRIDQKLTQYEQETGHQVVVLTVDSLEGDPIEDYALRVAEAWKLGSKEKDDGALLLVSKGDRKMRIEVGYGLEANLTDLQTQIIQQEVIIPFFKNNDYGGGIEKGVDAIVDTLKGKEPQAAAPVAPERSGRTSPGFLLFLMFFLFPFSAEAVQRKSWMLYLLFLPFYFFVGWLVAPIVGWILAGLWAVIFPILRAVLPKGGGRGSSGGRSGGGGWWLGGGGFGGGGGSWGGGSRGGGGGFSGGGGSFGGGGSSSSW